MRSHCVFVYNIMIIVKLQGLFILPSHPFWKNLSEIHGNLENSKASTNRGNPSAHLSHKPSLYFTTPLYQYGTNQTHQLSPTNPQQPLPSIPLITPDIMKKRGKERGPNPTFKENTSRFPFIISIPSNDRCNPLPTNRH